MNSVKVRLFHDFYYCRASASKSEDFLEVVGLQATFPSARLEGELVVLLAKDG